MGRHAVSTTLALGVVYTGLTVTELMGYTFSRLGQGQA